MIVKTEQEIMEQWKSDVNKPIVSICTITFNHEKYIEEALDSFLMQATDFPFEVIVDDDCSLDGAAEVIKRYTEKYPNIISANLRKKNVGMMTNFIENIKRAKGKYIALCEGDDYWTDPKKLQKQVDFLAANDEYVMTYTAVEAFDEKGKIESYIGGVKRDLEAIELQKATPINTLTVCFRNVIKDFPPESQCTRFGDIFLWSLLGHYGKGKYLENIKPARYRVHNGGAFSQTKKDTRLQMWLISSGALYAYYNRIGNQELANYFLKRNLGASIAEFGLYSLFKIFMKKILKIK